MSRCEHFGPQGGAVAEWRTVAGRRVLRGHQDARILACMWCGAALHFGPSNDSPEAVQVEIEAARIARDPQTAPEHGRTGPDGCAACGWAVARFDGSTPPIANAAAGWLAWQSANHDTHADA